MNSKDHFESVTTREELSAKSEKMDFSPFSLSQQELAQLSQETREFFNIGLSAQNLELRLNLVA